MKPPAPPSTRPSGASAASAVTGAPSTPASEDEPPAAPAPHPASARAASAASSLRISASLVDGRFPRKAAGTQDGWEHVHDRRARETRDVKRARSPCAIPVYVQ